MDPILLSTLPGSLSQGHNRRKQAEIAIYQVIRALLLCCEYLTSLRIQLLACAALTSQ